MQLELSLRGDYAVRAMVAIAALDDGSPVSARRIATTMHIPAGFLAHVLTDLVRAGVIVGRQGRAGGYRLTAPANQIDLLRVVDAVEDRGRAPRCVLRGGACRADGTCSVHDAFSAAAAAMRRELAGVTLAQLATSARLGDSPRSRRRGTNGPD